MNLVKHDDHERLIRFDFWLKSGPPQAVGGHITMLRLFDKLDSLVVSDLLSLKVERDSLPLVWR